MTELAEMTAEELKTEIELLRNAALRAQKWNDAKARKVIRNAFARTAEANRLLAEMQG